MRTIGQRFVYIGDYFYNQGEYLLCSVGLHQVCLIHLYSANRWKDPVYVENINNLTEKEWAQIATSSMTGEIEFKKIG